MLTHAELRARLIDNPAFPLTPADAITMSGAAVNLEWMCVGARGSIYTLVSCVRIHLVFLHVLLLAGSFVAPPCSLRCMQTVPPLPSPPPAARPAWPLWVGQVCFQVCFNFSSRWYCWRGSLLVVLLALVFVFPTAMLIFPPGRHGRRWQRRRRPMQLLARRILQAHSGA